MRRREVIALLTGSIALPLPTRGQPSPRPWRIGLLETTDAGANRANLDALRDGLRNLGYVEGRNLAIEYRSAGGEAGRFADMAAELVRLGVDVIVTRGTPAALAARAASSVVPIVMAASGEPSETGVIASLAHPGGNVTGLSSFNTQLELKSLELLLEIIPAARRLGGSTTSVTRCRRRDRRRQGNRASPAVSMLSCSTCGVRPISSRRFRPRLKRGSTR
jgi:putative ABC transport system substrate-binding protein